MSQLELHFLGPPEVRANGTSLSFPSRKALALLIYLVVEKGMKRRVQLAALLWPESDPSRARATLRNGLHQLRTTLPEEGFLHVERNALGFDFAADYWLDLDVVRGALSDAPSVEDLEQALELHRGDFLEGFSPGDAAPFDDWAAAQRTRWRQRRDELFDRLSHRFFDRGQMAPARTTVNRWLSHDPLNERAHRRLMRLHMAEGNRAAALQAYEHCRSTLAAELGVEPAHETRALAARIEQERTVGDHRTKSAGRAAASGAGEGAAPRFAAGPLVGRGDAFGALVDAYHQSAGGAPRLVWIIGAAGMGKTRLATDFLHWATAHGADVLRGRSFESSQEIPYQPLVDALRPRLEAINAPEDHLSDTWLAALSRLLPELLDRYPDLAPAPLDEAAARTRLFEAIVRLLMSLAAGTAGSPLILFLDDLQWADPATLDVLQYLSRRWPKRDAPLLLLVTARSVALDPLSGPHASPLVECRRQLERHLPTRMVKLGTLSMADTERFVTVLRHEADPDFAHWLFDETGGQPFFLVELLEDLRQRGVVETAVEAGGGWRMRVTGGDRTPPKLEKIAGVPARVRRLIIGRLARLGVAAFDLLAAAAVLGQGVTFELLCRVAGVEEGSGLHALDELLRGQHLRESETGATRSRVRYLFAHDKIRDVVYAEAGDARRRIFHRRAMATLAERGAPAGRLAYHALAAGQAETGFRHAVAAGDESMALFAARNAIGHYQKAREVGDRLAVDAHQLRHLYLQLGRAHELEGDYEAALAVYGELQEEARRRDDRPMELAALMARTTVYAAPTQHYDPQNVAILTEQALPLARALADHAAESKIQWNLMLLRLFTGDITDAVSAGEASLAIARRHELRERIAYALHDLTRAYLFSGRAEAGLDAAAEARALWRELDNKAMLVDNLISTASARFFWQGSTEPLIPRLEEALTLSREIDNRWTQSYAHHILGSVYYDMGRFGAAIEASEQAIALGLESGFMVPLFTNGSALAVIYGMVGRPDLGEQWVEKALAEETGMRNQRAAPLAARAFLHLCRGELDAAAEAIRRSHECLELESLSAGVFFTFPIDGRLRLARGEYDQALAVGQQLLDHLRQTGLRFFWPDGFFIRGRALLALARVREAEEELRRALEIAEATNSRRVLWEILAAWADLKRVQAKEEEASAAARRAAEVTRYIADHLDALELRRSFWQQPVVQAIQASVH